MIHTIEKFLSEKQCADIIYACIDAGLFSPSTVTDGKNRKPDDSRFSFTAHINQGQNHLVDMVNIRIAEITKTCLCNQEPMQVQYYPNGGFYRAHLDAFNGREGQRELTFMVYLNTIKNGGRTIFPKLYEAFNPRVGMAVWWNNLYTDGTINPDMLHEAELTHEPKFIMTKWIRRHEIK